MGALSGIKVLDLTRVLAGPYCTMMLADMGAEVIKVEIPGRGDDTRFFAPFKNGTSLYYANVNRNKLGVSLNLKSQEGKDLFLEMAKKADIVVENYRPGVMDKLGIGYDVLKEINPRIIYGAVSGFGCWGPKSQLPGYDIIAQAMGGLMSITGPADGGPCRTGSAMGDLLGGMNLTIGLLAALHSRDVTEVGQRVDVALYDSIFASLEASIQEYLSTGVSPKRMGNAYPPAYPYDSFHASDGDFIIACGNQSLFERLAKIMGREDLIADKRFCSMPERVKKENRPPLGEIINEWASKFTVAELVDKLLAAGVPAGPINDVGQAVADEHLKEREMLVPLPHPILGDMQVNGNPVKLMGTPVVIKRHAPTVPGENNEEVYCGMFGITKERLAELKEKGVI